MSGGARSKAAMQASFGASRHEAGIFGLSTLWIASFAGVGDGADDAKGGQRRTLQIHDVEADGRCPSTGHALGSGRVCLVVPAPLEHAIAPLILVE